MAFPTATITQGSGLTINTLPNAGQGTMANSLGVAIASDQSVIPVGGTKVRVDASFTREANATPYTAGDVVSAAAATVVPAVSIPNFARVNGGSGYIVGCRVNYNVKSVTPRVRVHVYSVNTATVSGDNLPFRSLDADFTKKICSFDLPAMSTPADTANSTESATQDFTLRIPFVCDPASRGLYLVLETLDIVTLTASSTAKVSLYGDLD